MEYKTSGSWVALASLVVVLLSKLGLSIEAETVTQIIAGFVGLYGVIKQWMDHRKLAVGASEQGLRVGGLHRD